MFRKLNLVALLGALLLLSNSAIAQTTVPLNTGYNHPVFNPYSPTTQDQYWINIASYPTTTPAIGPAWAIPPSSGWAPALPGTTWISARNSFTSAAGTSPENPSYTIFRKCFCLLPGYKEPKLSFQVRADDTIQIWLNSQMNQVLAPSWGNLNGTPLSAATTKGFRVGKNCVYVLLEDIYYGAMGFDLEGTISALGLLPMPAAGAGQSFEPCACRSGGPVGVADSASAARVQDSDEQVIREIVRLAETRRRAKDKTLFKGAPTTLEVGPGRPNKH